MPTLKDVARASGVSVMTVSNVVNGRPRVSEATRRRVLEAVDELGYQVNLTARSLRAGRSGTIALSIPRVDHPYFAELAAAVTDALLPSGQHLVVEQTGASREGELSALSQARLQMYDGVLLSVVGLRDSEVARLHSDMPLVLLGEKPMPTQRDHVMLGNFEGARLATAYLIERDARHVAIVGGVADDAPAGMEGTRTAGWRAAHEEAGLVPDERLILPPDHFAMAESRATIGAAIDAGLEIDGVFAVTDQVAIGVVAGLHDRGLRVPDDVQVVGFDDLEVSEHLVPGLTTVDPRVDLVVAEALRLLERRMSGDEGAAEHLVMPVRLVVRGTTR
ncbi:LacI family DNA-binding transcriptional regulator [Cellulomonas dongxiuzhuiae]|uniref:LacI family transcriptional regulator n=1 Tax=Cellulomonas dongxiuzhuiae TaxID=2819979 RepID=A0ABX8GL84_9CELL|nr:LacI family DNA-binding transcriptional regulator [Cellulomonas dongxiuzhuiae]MBO3094992.1 LacI family DNA-binding transcriptional regulator [Cellulomonas dongxiuzhuiae]QWC16009.1 LacI family transcriptional regulator [Cellulomonas dongxiuzhuiae]